jgi:hypothetical protein
MRKTSVYLTAEEREHLRWVAGVEGRSQSQVLREAIMAYRPWGAAPDRNFEIEGIAEGPGGSVADIPEEELLKGFGE